MDVYLIILPSFSSLQFPMCVGRISLLRAVLDRDYLHACMPMPMPMEGISLPGGTRAGPRTWTSQLPKEWTYRYRSQMMGLLV